MRIKEALEYGREKLNKNQYIDPLGESRFILGRLLKKDILYIHLNIDQELAEDIQNEYMEIITKRSNNIPLQYIFSESNFYNRDFYVDERVLIPRWDTEVLVEEVIRLSKDFSSPKILEIGVGSGAVSITIGKEIIDSKVVGLDISDGALEVANTNLNKFKVTNVSFLKSNLFENIKDKYDIMISNPPYIKSKDMGTLQEEVKKEPTLALDGGDDGLDFYRRITCESPYYLKESGLLVFEIGHDQYSDIKRIFQENNFVNIGYKKDLQGFIRVVWGTKGD